MNLLRDAAILELQRSNVEVLQEQLRQTRDRFNVGEVTRTDVAQSESRLAAGARADADRRIEPEHLARDLPAGDRRRAGQAGAGEPVDRLSPPCLRAAIAARRGRSIRR